CTAAKRDRGTDISAHRVITVAIVWVEVVGKFRSQCSKDIRQGDRGTGALRTDRNGQRVPRQFGRVRVHSVVFREDNRHAITGEPIELRPSFDAYFVMGSASIIQGTKVRLCLHGRRIHKRQRTGGLITFDVVHAVGVGDGGLRGGGGDVDGHRDRT